MPYAALTIGLPPAPVWASRSKPAGGASRRLWVRQARSIQPTGGSKAAITGDFVLTAKEVQPAVKALREHGIEVTALQNHMLDAELRLFFTHFWGLTMRKSPHWV
jgi:hypothetical protein